MSWLFNWASNFNQDISRWSTSTVTNMTTMFFNAQKFNQDLSKYCVVNIKSIPNLFDNYTDSWIKTNRQPIWWTCPQ